MTTHLYRRDGGTYYFRRAIPMVLRPRFDGRREWVKSLATKDRGEAKRLLPALLAAFDEAMDGSADNSEFEESAVIVKPMVEFASKAKAIRGRLSVPLINTFETYAMEQAIKPATAAEWRAMLNALIVFVGHDNAAALTVDDIDRWRDYLLNEPSRYGKIRSPGTVKGKYLCALRATLAWAVEKRLITNNVALSVKVRVPKRTKLRERSFSKEEATAILCHTFNIYPSLSMHERLSRRWIPWLCAYTGARVNEISQLRGVDVKNIDGVWTLLITPEAGTVKNGEMRQVPLHSDLLEQGFIRIANSAGILPIFFDLEKVVKPGASNRYYKKVGERLRDWVRLEVGITDPNVQPSHGWRHTFKSRAIDAGISERVADAIQGHAPRSVGQTYGTVSLAAKTEAIRAMPRFVIPAVNRSR